MLQIHALFRSFLPQPSKNAKQNLNPIYTDAPRFVRSVVNGKLYIVGTGEDAFDIVHVWGMWSLVFLYSDSIDTMSFYRHRWWLNTCFYLITPISNINQNIIFSDSYFLSSKWRRYESWFFLIIKANLRIKHKRNCWKFEIR